MSKSEQFHQAAFDGDLPLILELSKDPASLDPNWQDDVFKRTPFFNSCREGRLEVVKFLLGMEGVDLNLSNVNNASPFYVACQNGHVEIIKLLLDDQRIEVNRVKSDGASPFFVACQNGHVEVISILLSNQRVDVTQIRADCKATPLHIACKFGPLESISLLLNDPRIEVNAEMDDGETPFFIACQEGHVDVISFFLLDKRIEVDKPTYDNTSPIWIASQCGHLSAIQRILASGREIDVERRSKYNKKTAAEYARVRQGRTVKDDWETEEAFLIANGNFWKIAVLLDEYQKDSEATRWKLLRELHLDEPMAGELFALVVFLSDGYFKVPGIENENI